jgi:hypothetical protein
MSLDQSTQPVHGFTRPSASLSRAKKSTQLLPHGTRRRFMEPADPPIDPSRLDARDLCHPHH